MAEAPSQSKTLSYALAPVPKRESASLKKKAANLGFTLTPHDLTPATTVDKRASLGGFSGRGVRQLFQYY